MTTNVSQSSKDELERKLDEIRTVLGIQTTTTVTKSSVLEGIKRQLDHIDKQLRHDRRVLWHDRRILWFCLLPMQLGIALVIAGGATWWISLWTQTVTAAGLGFVTWGCLNMRRFSREMKREGVSFGLSSVNQTTKDKITPDGES